MKKITLSLVALLTSIVMLVSCGGGGDVKGSASAFINAMNKMDLETAKKYAGPNTKTQLDKMSEQMKTITPDQKKMFDEEVAKRAKYTITIKDVKENGDKAVVTFTSSEDANRVDSVDMIKQDGKWLAEIKNF